MRFHAGCPVAKPTGSTHHCITPTREMTRVPDESSQSNKSLLSLARDGQAHNFKDVTAFEDKVERELRARF